jgi:hypothetical protein
MLNYSADLDSDLENYTREKGLKPNMCDAGIQTSEAFTLKLEQDPAFKAHQAVLAESTDWEHSPLYSELQFKK